jgi:hypothetical protein
MGSRTLEVEVSSIHKLDILVQIGDLHTRAHTSVRSIRNEVLVMNKK